MIGEELVFFSFFYIKLFELSVEVALNHRSAVTHHKVNLLKFSLRSSSFERTDDAFLCSSFASASFTSVCWSVSKLLSHDPVARKIMTAHQDLKSKNIRENRSSAMLLLIRM